MGLAGASLLLFLGALLPWGVWRLTDGQFPIERLLAALAGLATIAATYLSLAEEKRRNVALLAMLSALITLVVVVLYTAEAGIGAGYLITIVAGTATATLSVLALTRVGAPPKDDDPTFSPSDYRR
jgi:hypothetical protein